MDDRLNKLEAIAKEFIQLYDVTAPPIPVETMLQKPRAKMWDEVDLNQMSGTFMVVRDLYSPRMSLARMLARHISISDWGKEHGLTDLVANKDEMLRAFARMLIMPADMVIALSSAALNPTTMSLQFEVPEEDARQRLQELADRL